MLKSKKILFIGSLFCILLVAGVCFLLFTPKNSFSFKYQNTNIPPSSYDINFDGRTRKLSVQTINSCSYVDCESSTNAYTTTLTTNEINKINIVFGKINKDHLCSILESIARDQEPFDDIENKVSSRREFGNNWLDSEIKELGLNN